MMCQKAVDYLATDSDTSVISSVSSVSISLAGASSDQLELGLHSHSNLTTTVGRCAHGSSPTCPNHLTCCVPQQALRNEA